jgi:hypothetical protein
MKCAQSKTRNMQLFNMRSSVYRKLTRTFPQITERVYQQLIMLQLFGIKCGRKQRIAAEVLMELKSIRDQKRKMKINDADLYIGRQRE